MSDLLTSKELFKIHKNSYSTAMLIIAALGYVILAATTIIINSTFSSFHIMGMKIGVGAVSGIITMGQMICCIYMVRADYKCGWYVSLFLVIISILNTFSAIIQNHSLEALPGIIMHIGSVIVATIIHIMFKKIEDNENQLLHRAITDPLTGLYNRSALNKFIDEKIKRKEHFYLLFLDMDNFKGINDAMGHKTGDAVLCTAAERWQKLIGEYDLITRNGGDEFSIVFSGNKEQLLEFVNRCIDVHSKVFDLDSYKYYASVSIGIAAYPENGSTFNELLKNADIAMYQAKYNGKNQYCIFTEEMSDLLTREARIENLMRRALAEKFFYLVFQPQFSSETCKLRGFEVLLRMKSPDGTNISPEEFIPIAERTGLIFDIDNWVLESAMSIIASEFSKFNKDIVLSVNVSAKHFSQEGFLEDILGLIEKYNVPPSMLEIEITEYCFAGDSNITSRTLKKKKKAGVKIALDDFGTGYASLNSLLHFPIDLLKIDKSLIDEINTSSEGFVREIISIGHLLDCEVIAEGVETESQHKALENYGCEYIQGFLLGKPMDLQKAFDVIKAG